MEQRKYLMESDDEAYRLDVKTDVEAVRRQARWAGIKPGMKVADVGCGSGITSRALHAVVEPWGTVTGIDSSPKRVQYAVDRYASDGVTFVCRDVMEPLEDLGSFDVVWVRFLLEYYRKRSFELVANIARILKPGGILCLIDLDSNAMNYYGMPSKLRETVTRVMRLLEETEDFDPYAGRKLYSYLYQMGFRDIEVKVEAHHLIYGRVSEADEYNWLKKIEVVATNTGYAFEEYEGGPKEFRDEFRRFLTSPARFIYTPLIACRGVKP